MGLFGKSGLQGPPTLVSLLVRDIQLRLSQWGYWAPYLQYGTLWTARAGLNAWKQFGPEPNLCNRASV